MELNIMELETEELSKVSGGNGTDAEYERIVKMTKDLIRKAKEWNRSFEDAIELAIFGFGDVVPESDIRAYARQIYGK